MKILKFSELKRGMDDTYTTTIFLDNDTVMKMSLADVIGMQAKIIDKMCRGNKIPTRVIETIKNSIGDIKEVTDKTKMRKAETNQRLAKNKKKKILDFVARFLTNETLLINNNELEECVGSVPRDRVVKFLEGEGFKAEYEENIQTLSVSNLLVNM